MKLGEAMLEREHLKQQLDLLGSRLLQDHEGGRPLTHIREKIQYTANRWRDLEIAIDWTEQQVAIADRSLGSYIVRQKILGRLSEIMEPVDREKADQLLEASHADNKVIETAVWLVDLQVPGIKASEEDPEAEEE